MKPISIRTAKILPGTGRGTMRSMVEGAHLDANPAAEGRAPSVSPSAIHLPVPGRN